MKPHAYAKMESIFKYPFFQSVGGLLPMSVTSVGSWERAVKEADTRKWTNSRLMARNVLESRVQQKSWDRGQEWNPFVQTIRPLIISFIDTLLPKTSVPEKFYKQITGEIGWDLTAICLEDFYKDLTEPFFYNLLLDPWYAAGHFPCGWTGKEFPDDWDGVARDGQLIVF